MEKIDIELDIIQRLQVSKAAEASGISFDSAIAIALDRFLTLEGYHNLKTSKAA